MSLESLSPPRSLVLSKGSPYLLPPKVAVCILSAGPQGFTPVANYFFILHCVFYSVLFLEGAYFEQETVCVGILLSTYVLYFVLIYAPSLVSLFILNVNVETEK